jgi:hypothetical protein
MPRSVNLRTGGRAMRNLTTGGPPEKGAPAGLRPLDPAKGAGGPLLKPRTWLDPNAAASARHGPPCPCRRGFHTPGPPWGICAKMRARKKARATHLPPSLPVHLAQISPGGSGRAGSPPGAGHENQPHRDTCRGGSGGLAPRCRAAPQGFRRAQARVKAEGGWPGCRLVGPVGRAGPVARGGWAVYHACGLGKAWGKACGGSWSRGWGW